MKSEEGAAYTLLMIKGHSLNNKPIAQMSRKQILAYIAAINIETEGQKKAQKRAEVERRIRRR